MIELVQLLTCSVSDLKFLFFCSVAWLVGWSLILEYTIGGAAVARGITPNLVYFIVDMIIVFPIIEVVKLLYFFWNYLVVSLIVSKSTQGNWTITYLLDQQVYLKAWP